jgi:hypothetical protein
MKQLYFICLFILICFLTYGQTYQLSGSWNFGGSSSDFCTSLCRDTITVSKGYTLAGYTTSNDIDVSGRHDSTVSGFPTDDLWVLHLDSTFGIQWQRCIGGMNFDYNAKIVQIADGGYIVVGNTSSSNGDVSNYHHGICGGNQCYDGLIARIDSAGNIIWCKAVGGSRDDRLTSVEIVSPNRILVTGYSGSDDGDVSGNHDSTFLPAGDGFDAWALSIDLAGNILWTKCYGSTNTIEKFHGSCKVDTNEIFLIGMACGNNGDVIDNHNVGFADAWIVKIDTNGTILSSRCYGGNADEEAVSFIQIENNKFSFLASATSSGNGDLLNNPDNVSQSIWLVTIDSIGQIVRQNVYWGSGFDKPKLVTKLNENKYVVAAFTYSTDHDVTNLRGWVDTWILFIDSTGTVLYQSCYGSSGFDQLGDMVVSNDLILIGATSDFNDFDVSNNYGSKDFWLYSLEVSTSINLSTANDQIPIYPNPSNDKLFINAVEVGHSYCIYNIQGQSMQSGYINEDKYISLVKLPNGIYFLRLHDRKIYKIIKQ